MRTNKAIAKIVNIFAIIFIVLGPIMTITGIVDVAGLNQRTDIAYVKDILRYALKDDYAKGEALIVWGIIITALAIVLFVISSIINKIKPETEERKKEEKSVDNFSTPVDNFYAPTDVSTSTSVTSNEIVRTLSSIAINETLKFIGADDEVYARKSHEDEKYVDIEIQYKNSKNSKTSSIVYKFEKSGNAYILSSKSELTETEEEK